MATQVLVLGGTGWLGPLLVSTALDRGAEVTCLTRGRGTVPDGARSVVGDRTQPDGYAGVTGTDWDVVLDTTWQPGMARSAVAALADRTGHWTFVSTTGVYPDDAHTARVGDPTVAPLAGDHATDEQYPAAKVACEEAVRGALADRCLVARSGLLVGPGDISDRFGYWVSRFALAGTRPVLVPDALDQPVQCCDARDLATWLVDAALAGRTGVLDAVGATWPLGEILDVFARAAGHTGPRALAAPDWLREHGVNAWMGERSLPLWRPAWFHTAPYCDDAPVREAGFVARDLADTAAATLDDERAQGLDRPRRAGLTRDDEAALIAALP